MRKGSQGKGAEGKGPQGGDGIGGNERKKSGKGGKKQSQEGICDTWEIIGPLLTVELCQKSQQNHFFRGLGCLERAFFGTLTFVFNWSTNAFAHKGSQGEGAVGK